jgi:hypothetical protein
MIVTIRQLHSGDRDVNQRSASVSDLLVVRGGERIGAASQANLL